MEITEEMLAQVEIAGACERRLNLYSQGQRIEEVDRNDLLWVEEELPELARKITNVMSKNTKLIYGTLRLSDFGYGSGYGYGYCSGDGYGNGDDSGSGYGYGN